MELFQLIFKPECILIATKKKDFTTLASCRFLQHDRILDPNLSRSFLDATRIQSLPLDLPTPSKRTKKNPNTQMTLPLFEVPWKNCLRLATVKIFSTLFQRLRCHSCSYSIKCRITSYFQYCQCRKPQKCYKCISLPRRRNFNHLKSIFHIVCIG